jgi:hypothetical protein
MIRIIGSASRWPAVVTKPIFAPEPVIIAFVATVVPW